MAWEWHCGYSADTCPDISLPDAGGKKCKPADDNARVSLSAVDGATATGCRYRCDSEFGFSLPTPVHFRKTNGDGSAQAWTSKITHSGELLRGYVKASERHVRLDLSNWTNNHATTDDVARRQGELISYLKIRGPTGKLHRAKPEGTSELRAHVPGLTCSDHLTVEVVGQRAYKEEVIPVVAGRVRLKHPEETMLQRIAVGFTAGGGVARLSNDFPLETPWEPYASVEALLTFRPFTRHTWTPSFLRNLNRIYLDARLGGMFTQQPHQTRTPRSSADPPATAGTERYARFPALGHAIYPFGDKFYFGVGGGYALGVPLRGSTDVLPFQLSQMWHVFVGGSSFGRILAPELGIRFVPQEVAYSFPLAGPNAPQARQITVSSLFIELRLHVGG